MNRVFITGASSGLGRALAQRYAETGATLGLLGRRETALRELAASLPGQHRCYAVDVRDRQALHAAATDFIAFCQGRVDVVIASAGISAGTLTEHGEDYDVFKAIVDTNLLATVATFEPFVGAMRDAGGGRLVGISSVAGVRGLPGAGAYSASKSAVTTYCESLRLELAGTASGRDHRAGLHQDRDDGAQPLFDAIPDGCRGFRPARPCRHRARRVVSGDSVADGRGGAADAPVAQCGL